MFFPSKYDLDHSFPAFKKDTHSEVNLLTDFPDKYILLVFYPFDFTTVCPTEINTLNSKKCEFKNTEIVLVSGDSVYSHEAWTKVQKDNKGIEGCELTMIGDYEKVLSSYFGLCEQVTVKSSRNLSSSGSVQNSFVSDSSGKFDQNFNSHPARATVILDEQRNVIHLSYYRAEIGRNTDEMLRIIKANEHFEKNGSMCLCDWKEE